MYRIYGQLRAVCTFDAGQIGVLYTTHEYEEFVELLKLACPSPSKIPI